MAQTLFDTIWPLHKESLRQDTQVCSSSKGVQYLDMLMRCEAMNAGVLGDSLMRSAVTHHHPCFSILLELRSIPMIGECYLFEEAIRGHWSKDDKVVGSQKLTLSHRVINQISEPHSRITTPRQIKDSAPAQPDWIMKGVGR